MIVQASTLHVPNPLKPTQVIFYLFCYFLCIIVFTQKTFKELNGLLCADVPLRNYSLRFPTSKIVMSGNVVSISMTMAIPDKGR